MHKADEPRFWLSSVAATPHAFVHARVDSVTAHAELPRQDSACFTVHQMHVFCELRLVFKALHATTEIYDTNRRYHTDAFPVNKHRSRCDTALEG